MFAIGARSPGNRVLTYPQAIRAWSTRTMTAVPGAFLLAIQLCRPPRLPWPAEALLRVAQSVERPLHRPPLAGELRLLGRNSGTTDDLLRIIGRSRGLSNCPKKLDRGFRKNIFDCEAIVRSAGGVESFHKSIFCKRSDRFFSLLDAADRAGRHAAFLFQLRLAEPCLQPEGSQLVRCCHCLTLRVTVENKRVESRLVRLVPSTS